MDRYHRSNITADKQDAKTSRDLKNAIRLVACGGILLTAAIMKLFFPSALGTVSENILPLMEEDIDYKEAVTAIGGTLTGQTDIREVLGDIYVKAFGSEGDNEVEAASEADTTDTPEEVSYMTPQEQLEASARRFKLKNLDSDVDSGEATTEIAADEYTNPAVATFLSAQAEFSDYGLPEDVSYELLDLGIDYTAPVTGAVSSSFGYRLHPLSNDVKFHYGTDIAADIGTNIAAFSGGTVTAVGESNSLGLYVIIQHENGVQTKYAHCSELYVGAETAVSQGDIIAAVGDTGDATGAHLHFAITVNGQNVNPEYYLILNTD